jgi:hypothetical protein
MMSASIMPYVGTIRRPHEPLLKGEAFDFNLSARILYKITLDGPPHGDHFY